MAKKRRHPSLVGLLREVSSVTQTSCSSFGSDTYPEGNINCCDDEDTTASNPSIVINMSTASQERYANSNNNTTSNVNCNHHHHHPTNPQDIGSELLHHLPHLKLGGLASVDTETLRAFVSPIYDALTSINAEELLDLQHVSVGGAPLGNGFTVRAIHEQIMPPKNEYRNGTCVRYLHVAEMEGTYSVGVFVFPPRATIPLHDHPGMCVLSRVLYGTVTKKALDLERESAAVQQPRTSWLSSMLWPHHQNHHTSTTTNNISSPVQSHPPAKNAKLAKRTKTEVLHAPAVTVLYPYEGNLHEFVAGPEGAAVLDVLLPPYGNHRDCTFYYINEDVNGNVNDRRILQPANTTPSDHQSQSALCWIVPTGQPEDFHCLSGTYRNLGRLDDDEEDEESDDADDEMQVKY